MLRHSYSRVGEDISLLHFIAPSFEFLPCLYVFLCTLFPVWLDVWQHEAQPRDGNKANQ